MADEGGETRTFETEGVPIVACWRARCLSGRLLGESSPEQVGRYLDLLFSAEELLRDPPDLLAPMQVWFDPSLGVPEHRRLHFGGYALTLERRDDGAWVLRAHDFAKWAEAKGGGLGIRPMNPAEVLWSMARDQRTPPEQIQIAGWNPPLERFIVAIPVEGVDPTGGALDTGSFGLTPDPEVPKRWLGLGPGELQAAFVEPQFWAVTWIEARTLWDAEQAAVTLFERLLGRVTLAARYSLPSVPGGTLRPFRRARQLAQARLRSIAGVEGLQTHRMWLRGYGRSRVDAELDNGSISGMEGFIGTSDVVVDEAITAWRRATTERDASAAVVALGEALEFYVAGTKVPRLFTKTEKDALQRAVADALGQVQAARETADPRADEKAKRVEQVLGSLNSPPFIVRLKAALAADEVPCNDAEFALLVRFRELRDKIVHGQERALPDEDELQQAIALVNRMLIFRLYRLRGQEPSASG